ncbi:unnamed protein product [Prorocentrum cordatum]|uniref:Apple domain-containing protein n=1 Tax=Prorocentrum cordatum TaxID=2364126 RepID=A0ABN9XWG5_9DINO|nr:unnamed protein product [Polarella glacialis]
MAPLAAYFACSFLVDYAGVVASGFASAWEEDWYAGYPGIKDALGQGSFGSYGGYGGYGGLGGYGGFGGDPLGRSYGDPLARKDKPSAPEDDCARLEASGVGLAAPLREAAELLASRRASESGPQLLAFFAGTENRRFLLAHCPQAVALAALLQAEATGPAGEAAAAALAELLAAAPPLRSPSQPPPVWGPPWEPLLHAAQQRTGLVIFPLAEQQFHVEHVSPAEWSIHPRRRCQGRRDLGNFQALPLQRCLAKCQAHPLCRSATFWQLQPGGLGFERRCFLSSTCTADHATADGAEGAVLFERPAGLQEAWSAAARRAIVAPLGAPWAPRCGHRMVAAAAPGAVGGQRLWLLGGVGVDPFAEAPAAAAAGAGGAAVDLSGEVGSIGKSKSGKSGKSKKKGKTSAKPPSRSPRRLPNGSKSNVIEAYLSRHVELSGEVLPLRSLPYGRLADVWRSDDLGATWAQSTSMPGGRRAFFGAVALDGGRSLLLLGGVVEVPAGDIRRSYSSDLWLGELGDGAGDPVWRQLDAAPWEPRAGFQALVRISGGSEEVLVLGGRLAGGALANDVWAASAAELLRPPAGTPDPRWRRLSASAAWPPRADFAAAPLGEAGLLVAGVSWEPVARAAPWGARVGAAAVALPGGAAALFGGYAYPDGGFAPLALEAGEAPPEWSAALWVSSDGAQWQAVSATELPWMPHAMHAAAVFAPCSEGNGTEGSSEGACIYVSGGLTSEGYYDNGVYRLPVRAGLAAPACEAAGAAACAAAAPPPADDGGPAPARPAAAPAEGPRGWPLAAAAAALAACLAALCRRARSERARLEHAP